MKGLIKLTTRANTEIWVNPAYIASMIRANDGGSILYIANDEKPAFIKDSVDDIILKIEAVYGVD